MAEKIDDTEMITQQELLISQLIQARTSTLFSSALGENLLLQLL